MGEGCSLRVETNQLDGILFMLLFQNLSWMITGI